MKDICEYLLLSDMNDLFLQKQKEYYYVRTT